MEFELLITPSDLVNGTLLFPCRVTIIVISLEEWVLSLWDSIFYSAIVWLWVYKSFFLVSEA